MKTRRLLLASVFFFCSINSVAGFDNPFDSDSYTEEQCREIGTAKGDAFGQACLDLIAQYKIAKKNKDELTTCTRAGVVTSFFLSISDEKNYSVWQNVEREHCEQFGVVSPKK